MKKKVSLLLTTLSIIVFLSGCTDTSSVENSKKTDEDNATKQLIENKDVDRLHLVGQIN